MNESLFSSDNKDDNKDYLAELVGEGKKFKSAEDLAKGKYFADADIAIKNRQLDEMRDLVIQQREQINTQESLEALIDQIKQRELASSTNTPAKEVKETKPMSDNDLDTLVSSKIQQHELRKKFQSNLDIVNAKLEEQFGDKVASVLKTKMDELDLTKEDIDALAKKSPIAFFNTLGLNVKQTENFQAPPRSQVRNDNFKPTTEKRTWAWYKQKYKNRDFVYNKDLNVQMAKDAAELGDSFYDGDFYNSYHRPA